MLWERISRPAIVFVVFKNCEADLMKSFDITGSSFWDLKAC